MSASLALRSAPPQPTLCDCDGEATRGPVVLSSSQLRMHLLPVVEGLSSLGFECRKAETDCCLVACLIDCEFVLEFKILSNLLLFCVCVY
ncbi:hypothetical protein GUJ93_ZPchr0013g36325 [Zizania palustris]|uniref:Uncharacterized protein n=1 Tax=Zizania palustris TaxID=103762 RepID=A0A8J6C024_ZIZPA|nr:hypothetical protein GUJ93_ZPchr0013g36325 [Zizania palustris]